jgi:hypothetical protein
VAVNDLGGLGNKEGTALSYNWTLPNLLPVFLPWLAILLLLLLKPNRCAQAWWVWIPVGCVVGVEAALLSEGGFLPSGLGDVMGGCMSAVGFGIAGVWLVAGYWGWKHRALAWLGVMFTLGIISVLLYVMRQSLEGAGYEMAYGVVLVAAATVVISAALTLAGLACRGHYGHWRLSGWLLVTLLLVWLVLVGPFFILAMVFSPGGMPVSALLGIWCSLAGISFGLLLPFLVLSFTNPFYRERLKNLLHLDPSAPPPIVATPVAGAAGNAGN